MLNILELEDLVKGMPDQRLMQEAKNPQGQVPQYLTLSEIQRRADMRKRYSAQEQQPTSTVSNQIINAAVQQPMIQGQPGMAQGQPGGQPVQAGLPTGMMPQAPQQMAGGGIVQLAFGGRPEFPTQPGFNFPAQQGGGISSFTPGATLPPQATLPTQAMGAPELDFTPGMGLPSQAQATLPEQAMGGINGFTPEAGLQAMNGYEPNKTMNSFTDHSGFAPNMNWPSMTLPDQAYGLQGPKYAEGGIVRLADGGGPLIGMGGYQSTGAPFPIDPA